MNHFTTFSDIIDPLFKLLGILVGSIAIFQLLEVKKKRLVDMYWEIARQHMSDECHERRKAVKDIELWFDQETGRVDPADKKEYMDPKLIEKFIKRYHDAKDTSTEKTLDIKVRHQIRFLNQVGILVKKRLIDRDLLFNLIGAGLEIDYAVMKAVLQGHRKAHDNDNMYSQFDYLWNTYNGWKRDSEAV